MPRFINGATIVLALASVTASLRCSSADDHGLPRFETLSELKADAGWSQYFEDVYGDLPSGYPVCVFDLWLLDQSAFLKAGLDRRGYHVQSDPKKLKDGDLFRGYGGLNVYHSTWTPAANHSWVEVSHLVMPTELAGAWIWNTPGSGVWANVGRTVVFPSHTETAKTHAEAIAFLRKGCSRPISNKWPQQESDIFGFCAREKGIDSVQFGPSSHAPLGTYGMPNAFEAVLTTLDGNQTCGVPNASATPLRVGWAAGEPCECERNLPINASCGLMPQCPMPRIPPWCGERCDCSPRLCGTHMGPKPWPDCEPAACMPWSQSCDRRGRRVGLAAGLHRATATAAAARAAAAAAMLDPAMRNATGCHARDAKQGLCQQTVGVPDVAEAI